jgi:hypothetical protein
MMLDYKDCTLVPTPEQGGWRVLIRSANFPEKHTMVFGEQEDALAQARRIVDWMAFKTLNVSGGPDATQTQTQTNAYAES